MSANSNDDDSESVPTNTDDEYDEVLFYNQIRQVIERYEETNFICNGPRSESAHTPSVSSMYSTASAKASRPKKRRMDPSVVAPNTPTNNVLLPQKQKLEYRTINPSGAAEAEAEAGAEAEAKAGAEAR